MQENYYNNRHHVKTLQSLPDNTPVWIQTENTHIPGTVVEQATTPRSYIISTPTGQIRRNKISLRHQRERGMKIIENEPPRRVVTRSQIGTIVKPLVIFRWGNVTD